MAWWAWLAVAVAVSAAEALGGEFVLLMLGGSALITALVAIGVDELWVQLLVFAVSGLATLFWLRPRLKRRYLHPSHIRSGIDALIGSSATVLDTVDGSSGRVKIGGEVWSAITMDGQHALPPGTPVTVVEVRGATAVVIWGP